MSDDEAINRQNHLAVQADNWAADWRHQGDIDGDGYEIPNPLDSILDVSVTVNMADIHYVTAVTLVTGTGGPHVEFTIRAGQDVATWETWTWFGEDQAEYVHRAPDVWPAILEWVQEWWSATGPVKP